MSPSTYTGKCRRLGICHASDTLKRCSQKARDNPRRRHFDDSRSMSWHIGWMIYWPSNKFGVCDLLVSCHLPSIPKGVQRSAREDAEFRRYPASRALRHRSSGCDAGPGAITARTIITPMVRFSRCVGFQLRRQRGQALALTMVEMHREINTRAADIVSVYNLQRR